jgi:hypothetical protein
MPRKQPDFGQITEHPIAVMLGFVASAATLLTILSQGLRSLPLLAAAIAASWLMWNIIRVKFPDDQPLRPNDFGASPFSKEYCWERPSLTSEVQTIIEKSHSKPVILVGRSGVGKSFLMSMVVERLREASWKVDTIERYDDFPKAFHKSHSPDDTPQVLVFDQFEQFLASATEGERQFLLQQVAQILRNPQHRLVFVVRDDAFYKFVTFLNLEHNRLDIAGIQRKSETGEEIVARLRRATKAPLEDVDQILSSLLSNNEMLPLEVRIVGYHLAELQHERGIPIDWKYFQYELGGKDGVIRSYFNRRIDNLSDPETGMAVLFALALGGLYKTALDVKHLSYVTHRDSKVVSKSLEGLQLGELVREANYTFELSHDFIGMHARDVTGLRLNPIDRDNILYFTEGLTAGHRSHHNSKPGENTSSALRPLSDPLFILLGLVLLMRLVYPVLLPLLGLSGRDFFLGVPTVEVNTASRLVPTLDRNFLPVAICIIVWMYFISEFHRRVLRRIDNDGTRWFSWTLWALSSAGGMVTAFVPSVFLVLIFVAGILLGLKMFCLSRMRGLARSSAEYFKDSAARLFWFYLFGIVVVVVILREFVMWNPSEYFFVFGWLSVGLTAISFSDAWNSYLAVSTPNRLLGLVDRRR